jgi:hypothetical protein
MHENLMEEVISRENATRAWEAVKRNQGAPGIDRMTTGELREHIRKHWEGLTSGAFPDPGTFVSAFRDVAIRTRRSGSLAKQKAAHCQAHDFLLIIAG